MLPSEEKWVHRPDSAFSKSTKSVMTVLGVIFFIAIIVGIFLIKKHFSG